MMLKEGKGEVRRRRGGTVPGKEGEQERQREAAGGEDGDCRAAWKSGLPGRQHCCSAAAAASLETSRRF